MENKFLKLTNTVYRLVEFFPESDPLKNRTKDKALAIMENLVLVYGTDGWASFQREKAKVNLLEDIDMLLGYLWIAKSQGWLSAVNCLIITHEYERIKKEVEPEIELIKKIASVIDVPAIEPATEKPKTEQEPIVKEIDSGEKEDRVLVKNNENITPRQERIIDFLEKNEKAQVMDLQTVLPNITKRTIRRDIDELLTSGRIVRLGDYNQVFYKIKR